eukprot:g1039.t1
MSSRARLTPAVAATARINLAGTGEIGIVKPGRRFARTFLSARRLRALEHEANANAASAAPQAAYLRELNAAKHHDHVLQRVESGAFATQSEEATKEYSKALVAPGRIDSANLHGMGQRGSAGMAAPAVPPPPALASTEMQGMHNGFGAFGSSPGVGGASYAGAASQSAGGAGGASPSPFMVKLVPNERTTGEKILDLVKGILPFVFIGGALMYATGGMDAQMGGGKKGTGLLGMLSPKELEPMTSDVTFE